MAYFIGTLLFTMFIPLLILPIPVSVAAEIYLPSAALYVAIPIQLILCFWVMYEYGYWFTNPKQLRKPLSRLGVYVPVLLPIIWYLLNTAIYNVQDLSNNLFAQIGLVIWTCHSFGSITAPEVTKIIGLNEWHSILLMNLIYDFILILGFAVGEYIAVKKKGIERAPVTRRKKGIAAIIAVLVVFVYTLSEVSLYRQRINIVDSAYPAYDFYYEDGYSSIDLEPYDVKKKNNILAKLTEPSTFSIADLKEMPILDGAEAAYPVYSAFANACYENIREIQKIADESYESNEDKPIQFTNTIYAYERLLSGEVDIFFGARPSEGQQKMAEEAGVELKLTPIGQEAFVFFVNEKNPVDKLSSEQLRNIYSGQINNWQDVGGENRKILAFQRPENSGSQTMMEYFMGDTPLKAPLEAESDSGMGDVVKDVANYDNGASSLGYSFRYYTTIMMADSGEKAEDIKLLTVDGVYPDTETIQSGEYPYITQLYAITVANRKDAKRTIEPFLEWMTGPQGQQIVSDTGYLAMK